MIRSFASIAIATLVASCVSGPPRMPLERIERALAGAPGAAQPGKIVAAEIAFARAAREDGQWTAFREFMGPNAQIHGRNGPIAAGPWLATQDDPPQAVKWSARSVWMSCDGMLAVSRGRFLDPQGKVGTFVTVWQQQENREYRWIYDLGAPDDPQPAKGELAEEAGIVVSADDIVQGHVADCPTADRTVPPRNSSAVPMSIKFDGMQSPDGTLYWRWFHYPDGGRDFMAHYVVDGEWQTATRFSIQSEKTN